MQYLRDGGGGSMELLWVSEVICLPLPGIFLETISRLIEANRIVRYIVEAHTHAHRQPGVSGGQHAFQKY